MKKIFKLCSILFLSGLVVSWIFSAEYTVGKFLPGTYIRYSNGKYLTTERSYKELMIKHLQGNKYRISYNDFEYNGKNKTPNIFDFKIDSINLKGKRDSIEKYHLSGTVTNIISNGATAFNDKFRVNSSGIISLTVSKNIIEVKLMELTKFSYIRKK